MLDLADREVLNFVLEREVERREHRRPRCYGISSDALVLYAVGRRPRPQVPGRSVHGNGMSFHGAECGDDYPHDEGDLGACELSYEMAPAALKERMLPVLEEFRAWVREGKNRYGEKERDRA